MAKDIPFSIRLPCSKALFIFNIALPMAKKLPVSAITLNLSRSRGELILSIMTPAAASIIARFLETARRPWAKSGVLPMDAQPTIVVTGFAEVFRGLIILRAKVGIALSLPRWKRTRPFVPTRVRAKSATLLLPTPKKLLFIIPSI